MYIKGVIVAEVDSSMNESTIRHSMCDLLVSTGRRCSKCEAHRKSLLVMLHRLDNQKDATDPKSHTNYRYLTSLQISERCSNLHTNCVANERKISRLKAKIEKLSNEQGVTLDPVLHNDMKSIMNENFSKISTQYSENTFERMFWQQHAWSAACKHAKGHRWHPAMIKWCLYLRHLSGRAYETLRNSGVIVLPSQRTLRDYTHYIPATIGFSEKVDEMLYNTMKVAKQAILLLLSSLINCYRCRPVLPMKRMYFLSWMKCM